MCMALKMVEMGCRACLLRDVARDSAKPLNGKVVSYADLSHPQCRKATVCSTLDVNEDNFGDSDKGGKHQDVTHTTSRGCKGVKKASTAVTCLKCSIPDGTHTTVQLSQTDLQWLSKLLTSPCGSESEGCVSDMNFLFTAEPEL